MSVYSNREKQMVEGGKTSFGQRLAETRRTKGMTQVNVAKRLDISFQAVSSWERGETAPEIDKLASLAAFYDVSLDWLLMGKTDKSMTHITYILN